MKVFAGQPYQKPLAYKIDQGRKYVVDGKNNKTEEQQLEFDDDLTGYHNTAISLADNDLLKNIKDIQSTNNIRLSNNLCAGLGRCQLDVEMETGTGKTYVYIKTMFELNKIYGWSKFIVIVPSIAIREGVKKSFEITADHFMEQYGKKARFFIYNSNNLSQIDNDFSQTADIAAMIINTQAFNTLKENANNGAARIIYSRQEKFRWRRPIDVIAKNNPILILDEPQKMGGKSTQNTLKRFNPLFVLNYSATHKEAHNPVYVLDALDAFNNKLVKKIEVKGFELKNLQGVNGYLYLQDIIISKNEAPKAVFEMEIRRQNGIKRENRRLQAKDDLYHVSEGMEQYRNCKINNISYDPYNLANSHVEFTNGNKMHIGEVIGDTTHENKVRIQIRETIRSHFDKERDLFAKGIKCLSLFFIDHVANYREYTDSGEQVLGKYGQIFEEEYKVARENQRDLFDKEYNAYLDNIAVERTHAGYFSIDKHKRAIDSPLKRGTDYSDDISAYDLIMKDKERLLSFEEPVRFIFSHSALREGWDNPNVFQICALRQENSDTQKRQEVGRGLRLAVNNEGRRMDIDALGADIHKINNLTVIASESFASFASALQSEITGDLYDRPTKVEFALFDNKIITLPDGEKYTITSKDANTLLLHMASNGYVDVNGNITPKFKSDAEKNELLDLPDNLAQLKEGVYNIMKSLYDPSALNSMITNSNKPTITNKLNDNFQKKEFQELWNNINHKFAYTVSFESVELIEKAIAAINSELIVPKLMYVVTTGSQNDNLDIHATSQRTEVLSVETRGGLKYDLLGKIASNTKLTRKTVALILQGITPSKFALFKENPEEFIAQVSRLIMEQKATVVVEHIEYNMTDEKFSSDIFTSSIKTDKAYSVKKAIQDYVVTDGIAEESTEHKFMDALELSEDVEVYAKLPTGFKIPTPIDNYTPDWAIAFKKNSVKHVYFVAETKGSMSSLELRGKEKGKIECAKKLFEQLNDKIQQQGNEGITYGTVNSFDKLMNIVKG